MTPTEKTSLSLTTEPCAESDGTDLSNEVIEPLGTLLAKADERIASLESELLRNREALVSNRAALNLLLTDDLQTCEELAELQNVIWGYHRGLPGDCECNICVEVEQRQRELKGFIVEDVGTFQSFRDIL